MWVSRMVIKVTVFLFSQLAALLNEANFGLIRPLLSFLPMTRGP